MTAKLTAVETKPPRTLAEAAAILDELIALLNEWEMLTAKALGTFKVICDFTSGSDLVGYSLQHAICRMEDAQAIISANNG